jgi:hypothetical protein
MIIAQLRRHGKSSEDLVDWQKAHRFVLATYSATSAAFWRQEFKDSLFRFIYFLKHALKQTRSGCLRAF